MSLVPFGPNLVVRQSNLGCELITRLQMHSLDRAASSWAKRSKGRIPSRVSRPFVGKLGIRSGASQGGVPFAAVTSASSSDFLSGPWPRPGNRKPFFVKPWLGIWSPVLSYESLTFLKQKSAFAEMFRCQSQDSLSVNVTSRYFIKLQKHSVVPLMLCCSVLHYSTGLEPSKFMMFTVERNLLKFFTLYVRLLQYLRNIVLNLNIY